MEKENEEHKKKLKESEVEMDKMQRDKKNSERKLRLLEEDLEAKGFIFAFLKKKSFFFIFSIQFKQYKGIPFKWSKS